MASKKLRNAARGQTCTVMLYPYCNQDAETVVLAHAPSDYKGMGVKSPDWWGADACSVCHDIIDGRRQVKDITKDQIFNCHIRGVYRTLARRIEGGLINVPT